MPVARRILVVVVAAPVLVVPLLYANLSVQPLPSGQTADFIRLEKSARRLTLLREHAPLKTYRVALGREPVGPKEREGDGRTPEGRYVVDFHKPDSSFHLALHISYPNQVDEKRAQALGVSPGGQIMIHGLRNGLGLMGKFHRLADWTKGCIAVTNPEIEEIYRAVADGTPVEIVP